MSMFESIELQVSMSSLTRVKRKFDATRTTQTNLASGERFFVRSIVCLLCVFARLAVCLSVSWSVCLCVSAGVVNRLGFSPHESVGWSRTGRVRR